MPSSKPKAKRGNAQKTEKSRGVATADPSIEIELKNVFREIILKYKSFFDPGARSLKRFYRDDDLSDALEIEVIDQDRKIIFPSTLTSLERKIVHEISEELSLPHKSIGEGAQRKISVFFDKSPPGQKIWKSDSSETRTLTDNEEVSLSPVETGDICNRFDALPINDDAVDDENRNQKHDEDDQARCGRQC